SGSARCKEKAWEIVGASKELAVIMAKQRCRLELHVPNLKEMHKLEPHVLSDMDVIRDKEEGSPVNQEVVFVVTPALRKWGNGGGQRLEECTVVVPAEVLTIRKD
ncbi:MAG: hypothetical protein M1814_002754, partial [Vezdaea aestivalis]